MRSACPVPLRASRDPHTLRPKLQNRRGSGSILKILLKCWRESAAKAAIAGLTLTISDELIDAGITVNTVNPGPVDTGYVTEADREATAVMFPQGRWGEPDDAARLITWLLTDEARWITGQVINSEGGFARWRR